MRCAASKKQLDRGTEGALLITYLALAARRNFKDAETADSVVRGDSAK
jgi:hypothetical protein